MAKRKKPKKKKQVSASQLASANRKLTLAKEDLGKANKRAKQARTEARATSRDAVRRTHYMDVVLGASAAAGVGLLEGSGTRLPTFQNADPRLVYGAGAVAAGGLLDWRDRRGRYQTFSSALMGLGTGLLAAGANRMAASQTWQDSRVSAVSPTSASVPGTPTTPQGGVLAGMGYHPPSMMEIGTVDPRALAPMGYAQPAAPAAVVQGAPTPAPDPRPELSGYGYGGQIFSFDDAGRDDYEEGEL